MSKHSDLDIFKVLYKRFYEMPDHEYDWSDNDFIDYYELLNYDEECSNWFFETEMKKKNIDFSKYCCQELTYAIAKGISSSGEKVLNEVNVILKEYKDGSIGIPVHNSGNDARYEIKYCPFCGSKLHE